ncbi:MAG: aldose epimerase [Ktedonobacteraceae bacterium]
MATFANFPQPREHVLSSGRTTIAVIPEICLVSHFQVGPWPVLYRAAETGNVKRWGLPLMIPNFARLKQGIFREKGTTLPTHGFGRNLPWTVVEQDQTSISIQLSSSEQTRSNYPYEFTFTSLIAVGEEGGVGTLTYTLTMENRGDEVMPIAPGFHPYFAIAQQDKTGLKIEGLDFDARKVLWDTQPPDEPHPFAHQVRIDFPHAGTLTILERPVAGAYALSIMQVWSEPVAAADHNFVCFEPVVTSEDGLNRPQDRLNIAPHSVRQIILQFSARAVQ